MQRIDNTGGKDKAHNLQKERMGKNIMLLMKIRSGLLAGSRKPQMKYPLLDSELELKLADRNKITTTNCEPSSSPTNGNGVLTHTFEGLNISINNNNSNSNSNSNNNNNNNNYNINNNKETATASPRLPRGKNEEILVKVYYPALQLNKLMKLNQINVSYDPLIKVWEKVAGVTLDKSMLGLYTESGVLIPLDSSLTIHHLRDRDTVIFRFKDAKREDLWTNLCSLINGFLKKRPPVEELMERNVFPPNTTFNHVDSIPMKFSIVEKCLDYLYDKKAYKMEGIFRLSGSANEIQNLYNSFKKTDFDITWVENAHTVASALKQYTRFLTPPLLSASICIPLVSAVRESERGKSIGTAELNKLFSDGLQQLPAENKIIFIHLMKFLKTVLDHQAENRMGPQNLSIVWGPNLVYAPSDIDIFSQPAIQAAVFYMIVSNVDEMFAQ